MRQMRLFEYLPIVRDIMDKYMGIRENGYKRQDAINQILREYEGELSDFDDGPQVYIGIALALCEKRELTDEYLDKSKNAINKLLQRTDDPYPKEIIENLRTHISQEKIGDEATIVKKRKYDPGWLIGDTFIHQLSHPDTDRTGVKDWYVLFRKVGEYQDRDKNNVQVVYVSVCSPDKVPDSNVKMNQLGIIRMRERGGTYFYMGHLYFKNEKDKKNWKLEKIGHFPQIVVPLDARVEDPYYSTPIFGVIKKGDLPDYEDFVCRRIRFYGLGYAGDRC